MRIAILGATSQIAIDLVRSFLLYRFDELALFARRPSVVTQRLLALGLSKHYAVADLESFSVTEYFDAIINFVGVGNPVQAVAMGASIFDVTLQYDEIALNYVRQHPHCRYIFLSSGAAYGSNFEKPVDENTKAIVAINNLVPQDWYGIAKMYAECRHRSLPHLPIVDIRVFNYFSHTQDMSARFLITDTLRAIRDKTILQTSRDHIVRDFIHPEDFYQLITAILLAPAINVAVDAFSKAPVNKSALLRAIEEQFSLQYVFTEVVASVNATGSKPHYYSCNTKAADFGFEPTLTSLDGVLLEFKNYFEHSTGA
jgi:nucleoside-diphosphate-sugar epimerase